MNMFVHFLDCCDGFTCAQTFHIVHFKYVQFVVCQLYLNTVVKNLFLTKKKKETLLDSRLQLSKA